MPTNNPTRDRVRALVREVLDNAAPETAPSGRFIDIAPVAQAPAAPEFDRDESAQMVVTEEDLRGLGQGARVRVAEGARLTPAATDFVREHGLVLMRRAGRRGTQQIRRVAVGADHGGYPLKEELKKFLAEEGQRVLDFGTNSTDAVDYPDFAQAVAQAVAQGRADVGIIIDGAGIGSAMAANKVPGVRAAACYTVALAQNSREHNGANVLTLGSGTISEKEMRAIVAAWLGTDLTEPRHRKRVDKIMAIERQYFTR
jgi:ribose 5-phosphate isomerase B